VYIENRPPKSRKSLKDKELLKRIRESVEQAEKAPTMHDVTEIKKLRKSKGYFRVRIGDYRIGLVAEGDVLTFVRCLHRKDIYRYFP
jgi:mRNA interferase RelE/StbE